MFEFLMLSQHYWQIIDEVEIFVKQWMYDNHKHQNIALRSFSLKSLLTMVIYLLHL